MDWEEDPFSRDTERPSFVCFGALGCGSAVWWSPLRTQTVQGGGWASSKGGDLQIDTWPKEGR